MTATERREPRWQMDEEEREWLAAKRPEQPVMVFHDGPGSGYRLSERDAYTDAHKRHVEVIDQTEFAARDILAVDLERNAVQIRANATPLTHKRVRVRDLDIVLAIDDRLPARAREFLCSALEHYRDTITEMLLRANARANGLFERDEEEEGTAS